LQQFLKTRTFKIAAVVALLVGLYALAGFWLAPKLVRNALNDEIPKTLEGVKPSIGEIHINPFLLKVEVKDFYLTGLQGTKLVGFGRLFIDFEFSSLWHRAYTFKNIDIDSPFANAVIFKDGKLNLAQLSPKAPEKPQPEPKSKEPIPALRIASFKVNQGFLSFDDRRRPSDFATRLEPINFELQNFTTGIDGGRFTFTGTSKLGERVEWHGHVAVQPIESDGEFQIVGLQAHTIWEYLADQLSFSVNSGKIDVAATYKFSLKDDPDLKVDVSKVELSDLQVRPKNSDIDWITVPQLLVSGTTVDLKPRHARTDSVSLTGLKLVTWLEPDGSVNLLKLAAPPAPASSIPPSSAPPALPAVTQPASPANAAPAWTFELHEFALNDASISAEDRRTKPVAKVVVAPLSVKVTGASLDLAKPLKLALDAKINGAGTLNVTGDVTPQPVAANLNVKLNGIELAAAQPYIAQYTSMTLMAGALSGDTKVRYGAQKPALQFTGNLSVAGLHTVDNALHENFINWDRLDVQGLNYQHDPDRLDIDQILARKLYARVIIEPDESINVKRVLAAPGATVVAPSGGTEAPVAATAAPAPAPPLAQVRKGKASPKSAAASASAATAPAATPGMPMSIKKIALQASEADFADLSVKPNFATGIQKLEGTILGLSSKANSRAKIDLHGSVDAFAPVSITGEANFLGATLYTDIAMSFKNIELSTFNPYSGKFAGYNISKGKLTTELHYKVDGRKLDAQHHIIVDQLEFGEKTESKEAVSLPVKLAVALLKDRDGVIDLNLPVTGSLDDPKFRLGPIIWKVFVNILEKAVTAPFALLGSLFGGGPDLQFVDFQPGTAELDPAAIAKAQSMVKALDARPQLKIEIPIAVVKDLDRTSLIEAKFQAQVQDARSGGGRKKPGSADAAFDQLDPSAQLDILAKLYAKDLGADPKFPDSVDTIKTKPEKVAAKNEFLIRGIHEHIAVDESDLAALGQLRATNLQQALLTGTQIDPQRVFLVANDKAKNQDGRVRLELSLR
jgi:Domain of Unknown Function (DUF748)